MMRHLLLILALFVAGCGGQPPSKAPVVLAAASLQDALGEAADQWAKAGHAKPVLSFAGSSALARQIEAGAPADLFISADAEWMDRLDAKRLIDPASRTDLAGNQLVLIAPAGSTTALAIAPGFPIGAALGQGRLALADPAAVPAGKYAKAALEALGVWKPVENRIAAAENVRAALALVERGEAPLGIVYATDAKASAKVRVVATFPRTSHPPIVYPVARLKASRAPEAEAFRTWLLGPGQAILSTHGFSRPEPR